MNDKNGNPKLMLEKISDKYITVILETARDSDIHKSLVKYVEKNKVEATLFWVSEGQLKIVCDLTDRHKLVKWATFLARTPEGKLKNIGE